MNETPRSRKLMRLPSGKSKGRSQPYRSRPAAAHRTIEGSIDDLASEILRAILPKSATLEKVR